MFPASLERAAGLIVQLAQVTGEDPTELGKRATDAFLAYRATRSEGYRFAANGLAFEKHWDHVQGILAGETIEPRRAVGQSPIVEVDFSNDRGDK